MERLAALIEASALGVAARSSDWLYPAANVVHLLGLTLLLGAIGLIDLRVAGAFRALPVNALARALTPLGIAGLALLAASGAVLFAADATTLIHAPRFQAKVLLIALALANALLFRRLWDGRTEPSSLIRALALGSLALWLGIAALGRLIAYG